jgi:hypothetical protein
MENSADLGRAAIYDCLETLKKFNDNKPDPFIGLLQVIIDGKSEEFVNIFAESPADQKQKVLKILVELDPAGGTKYSRLKQ